MDSVDIRRPSVRSLRRGSSDGLVRCRQGRALGFALEPTGTYGLVGHAPRRQPADRDNAIAGLAAWRRSASECYVRQLVTWIRAIGCGRCDGRRRACAERVGKATATPVSLAYSG